ncbi:MAG: galactose-1-phosphate uridylyltransferase [Chloroflexi bacterium]|nr:galactose-1-phosphate uridylyltransferase [Chloroflexota bacterium]
MSELRQDPTTREWVIIATERARRPHEFVRDKETPRNYPLRDPKCPFCPGNESETPPEVLRYSKPGTKEWQVRVVPNRFPALSPKGTVSRRTEDSLFRSMDGFGVHEVIVESPLHNVSIATMGYSDVELVLHAYRERFNALKVNPNLKYITIFKNYGETAGTSLVHPHSQLIATPVASHEAKRKRDTSAIFEDDTGSCLYCHLIHTELMMRKRIVEVTDDFVVFHPFASRSPFETWIAPILHQPSFALAPEDKIPALARVLRDTLKAIATVLKDPDYNLVLHTSPTDDEYDHYYDWHIRIIPRLTTVAGFEMGSGIYISTALPENTAAFMREQISASRRVKNAAGAQALTGA